MIVCAQYMCELDETNGMSKEDNEDNPRKGKDKPHMPRQTLQGDPAFRQQKIRPNRPNHKKHRSREAGNGKDF